MRDNKEYHIYINKLLIIITDYYYYLMIVIHENQNIPTSDHN